MSRFSVEKNMIGAAPITTQSQQPIVMPTVFDKFTVAIDRDGVLCECGDAITGPDKYIQIQDSANAVALIRSKAHKIVILFDQPSVVQRRVTVEQVEECNRHMLNTFGAAGCTSIDGIWYSTSSRKDDVYAKPNLGLFKHAEANSPGVKLKGGVYVGDSLEDLIMADKAGATPVLVLTGNGQKTLKKLDNHIYRMLKPKVKVFENLMAFAQSL